MYRQSLTKAQLKKLHKYADAFTFNPGGCLSEVYVSHPTYDGGPREVRFQLKANLRHANVMDSRSLAALLQVLQSEYGVRADVTTMWVGIRDGALCVWCPIF